MLNERVWFFLTCGTGIAISIWQCPNYHGLEERGVDNNDMGEGVKKKNNGIEIRADGRCRAVGNRGHGVRGDIYAVLVRDRAVRHLTRVDNRWADHRHDAGWPFIR